MKKRVMKRSKKISLVMIFILGLALSQGFFLVEPSLAKTAHEINAEVDEALNLFPQYISGGKEFSMQPKESSSFQMSLKQDLA